VGSQGLGEVGALAGSALGGGAATGAAGGRGSVERPPSEMVQGSD